MECEWHPGELLNDNGVCYECWLEDYYCPQEERPPEEVERRE